MPSASADETVNAQKVVAPENILLRAVVVPSEVVPENSSTVLLASADPVNVGVLSEVMLSVDELPKSETALRSGVVGVAVEVSMTRALLFANEPDDPGDGSVRVALLPAASLIVPPLRARADVDV